MEQLAIAALKALAIDATNKAKSGHPGMPIGSAPMAYTLFTKHLIAHPEHPEWINRDRFVLSAGHASMLLYGMLHLCGYGVTLDDLKSFRQLHSKTPGHPEVHLTPGVDATTGPLGQGIAQAVGMALAERSLRFQTQSSGLIDHYTYVLSGDGCLQEGVSQEAISFAGHQKLNRLILIYDANDVTLDGPLAMSFSEDVPKRFSACGWQVIKVEQGSDLNALQAALKKARKSKEKPTLIMMKTIIGEGSKNQGTYKVHGNPLGIEDGQAVKKALNWNYPEFTVPQEIYQHFADTFKTRGQKKYKKWLRLVKALEKEHPDWVAKIKSETLNAQIENLSESMMSFPAEYKEATRNTSLQIIQKIAKEIPSFLGGSADVAKSVMTTIDGEKECSAEFPTGRNLNFGIREFAMAGIQNGMLLHGGLKTYIGTFLAFADYMKPAVRLAALSHIPGIFLYSHDSVALGEDGPTHQPIDQLAMLRAIPNMNVFRPADARETLAAWLFALKSKTTPTAIVLTRQALPLLPLSSVQASTRGAYEISPANPTMKVSGVLIATGSEVSLCVATQKKLAEFNINVKVISMPSTMLFDRQDPSYQNALIGQYYNTAISVEALSTFGWTKYAKHNIGIDQFGVSAPGNDAMQHFGFSVDKLAEKVKQILTKSPF